MQTDICMYSRLGNGELGGALIIRVDDILYVGKKEFLGRVESAIKQFRIGGIEILSLEKKVIFTGLEIQLSENKSIVASQKQYISELPTMGISQYVNQDKIANVKDLQSTFRQGLGGLIWIHQSRPDVGYLIAKMATDLITACADAKKAVALGKLYNKIARFLKNRPIEIKYAPPPNHQSSHFGLNQLKAYRIICFTDAGFATLHDDHIIEPNVTLLGNVLFRDGIVHCHGFLIDHRCAKIQRACKSSLSAECHAEVTAGDYSLRYQIILVELVTHRYQIRKLRHPTNCPMLNPFEKSPSGECLSKENLYYIHR